MTTELLTPDEHLALELSAELALLVRKIIGDGPDADYDWAMALDRIHAVEHSILAQAAARAYPEFYRPLGGWDPGGTQESRSTTQGDVLARWREMNGQRAESGG